MDGNKLRNKKPENEIEGVFWDSAHAAGWETVRRGWPDFLCYRDGDICMVEVKPSPSSRMSRHQEFVMGLLARAGIKCYIWNPETGFSRVTGQESPVDKPAEYHAGKLADKVCANDGCGEIFSPVQDNQKYCCRACGEEQRLRERRPKSRVPTKKTCDFCGSEFMTKNKQQRFCSQRCSSDNWVAEHPRVYAPAEKREEHGGE